jgi:hypothetical protein
MTSYLASCVRVRRAPESLRTRHRGISVSSHILRSFYSVFAWQEAPGEQWTDLYEACGEKVPCCRTRASKKCANLGLSKYEDSKPVKDDAEFCTNKTLSYCTSVEPTPGRCTEEQ